jgi:hypothetical protein
VLQIFIAVNTGSIASALTIIPLRRPVKWLEILKLEVLNSKFSPDISHPDFFLVFQSKCWDCTLN